jgi:hypothetical protein
MGSIAHSAIICDHPCSSVGPNPSSRAASPPLGMGSIARIRPT